MVVDRIRHESDLHLAVPLDALFCLCFLPGHRRDWSVALHRVAEGVVPDLRGRGHHVVEIQSARDLLNLAHYMGLNRRLKHG